MNHQHEKSLKSILGAGASAKFSPALVELVERTEQRCTRFYGAFQEMSTSELAALIGGMTDEECFVKEDAPESAQSADYSKLSKSDLVKECTKRKLNIRGSESNAELAALLTANDKE